MPTTIAYEKQTCTRCSGSGQYSFNLKDGTVCYGCGGKGTQLTKAGKKARARVEAWKTEHLTVLARDLKAGDVIEYRSLDGRTRRVVESVSFEPCSWSIETHDGVEYWIPSMTVQTANLRIGFSEDSKVRLAATSEKFEAMVAFVRTIKSGLTVEER